LAGKSDGDIEKFSVLLLAYYFAVESWYTPLLWIGSQFWQSELEVRTIAADAGFAPSKDEQIRRKQRIKLSPVHSVEGYSLQFAVTSVKPLLSINYGEYR
jgi:hypothetical protein